MKRFYKIIYFLLIIAPLVRVASQDDKQPDNSSQVEYQDNVERARQNMADTADPLAPSRERIREAKERMREAQERIRRMDDPASPDYDRLVEHARRLREEEDRRFAPVIAEGQARRDYYQALSDEYSDFPTLSNADYDFLETARTAIDNPGFEGDRELERDRLYAAAFYADKFHVPIETVLTDLDEYREKWHERTALDTPDYAKETATVVVWFLLFIILYGIGYIVLKNRLKKKTFNAPKISLPIRKNGTRNTDELLKYHTLLKEGAITQEEYEKIKSKILRQYQ